MTTTLAEAVVYFKGDDKQLSSDLDKAQGKTKSWASGVGSIAQGALMGIGMGVVGLVTSATQQAVAFVGDSVGAASDMSETISKVSTVFGDSAAGILAWSETSAQAFGLSKQAALDAAGGLGNMFMQLGAGSEQAGTVSQDMVQLAADLASFHNAAGGTTEVLDTMTAAFRGEYDSVQRFIPTINAAAVELKALEMTGKSNAKELTNLEKALAVQAIMMENAGAAAGDFARTSDGLANQQRILDAQMDNLKATVGEALLPVMLAFTSTLNNIVQAVLPPLTNFIRDQVVPVMSSFGEVFGRVQEWFVSFNSSLDTNVNTPLSYFQKWINTNMPLIQTLFERVLGAIQGFWNLFGEDILHVVNNTFTVISTVIGTVLATIGDTITLFLQLITGDWEGAWETFKGIFVRIWETIKTVVTTQLDSLRTIFSNLDWGKVGETLINAVLSGIQAAWSGLTGWVTTSLQNLWNSITGVDWAGAGKSIVEKTKTGAQSVWGNFSSWVQTSSANLLTYWNTTTWEQKGKDAIGAIQKGSEAAYTSYKTSVATLIDGVLGFFTGEDWTGTGEKLVADIETGIANSWNNFLAFMGPKALDIWNTFQNIDWAAAGNAIVEGIKTGIENAWTDFSAWFLGKLQELAAWLPFSEPKNASSPLRNLGKSGAAFVTNWREGAEKEMLNLQGSMGLGFGNLMNGINSALSGSQHSVAAAGGMNIVVNVSGDKATYEAGRAVGRGIQDELRKRGQ